MNDHDLMGGPPAVADSTHGHAPAARLVIAGADATGCAAELAGTHRVRLCRSHHGMQRGTVGPLRHHLNPQPAELLLEAGEYVAGGG